MPLGDHQDRETPFLNALRALAWFHPFLFTVSFVTVHSRKCFLKRWEKKKKSEAERVFSCEGGPRLFVSPETGHPEIVIGSLCPSSQSPHSSYLQIGNDRFISHLSNYSLHSQSSYHLTLDNNILALMMEATNTSETSENFYQATRRNMPEDSRLHNPFLLQTGLLRINACFGYLSINLFHICLFGHIVHFCLWSLIYLVIHMFVHLFSFSFACLLIFWLVSLFIIYTFT
jgi:hypothetical protein